jgi:hypothetical protein
VSDGDRRKIPQTIQGLAGLSPDGTPRPPEAPEATPPVVDGPSIQLSKSLELEAAMAPRTAPAAPIAAAPIAAAPVPAAPIPDPPAPPRPAPLPTEVVRPAMPKPVPPEDRSDGPLILLAVMVVLAIVLLGAAAFVALMT